MDPKKIDLQSETRLVEAVAAELNDAELSIVSGGKASAVLMKQCVTGKHFPSATVVC